MKIRKINLYGFGQHENLEIDLRPGMNLLYGPNEAGKTTIQQAILHILFGFPQKNQQELRYEPKTGGKYGGCLYIEDQAYGNWMIERVRGKSSGDVLIRFEDGRMAEEEELKRLLRGYDRQAFESIFSFSLFQLQDLEKMDENDLSRTLLASGTTGLDTLWKVEKKMEKEMGGLFKKSGKIPPMNKKMAEIRELEQAMQKEQQKLSTYEPLTIRKLELDEQVAALRLEEQRLYKQSEEQRIAMQIVPLQQQRNQLLEQLSHMSDEFPAAGIRRYEELASKHSELQLKKTRLEKEQAKWQSELIDLRPDNERRQLERWVAQEAEWHRLRTDRLSAEQEIRLLEKKRQQFSNRLGLTEDQQLSIGQIDVSIQRERQLEPILEEQKELDQQQKALQRLLAEAENERQEAEQRKERNDRLRLTESERAKLAKWPQLQRQLAEAKFIVSAGDKQASNQLVPIVILLIGLAIGAYSILQQQWLFAGLGLIVAGVGAWLWKQRPDSVADQQSFIRNNEALAAELERLAERGDRQQRDQRQVLTEIERLDRKLQNYAEEMEQLHYQKQQAGKKLQELMQDEPFDLTFNIQESFRLLREFQDAEIDHRTWQQRLQTTTQQLQSLTQEVENMLGPVAEESLFERIRQELLRQDSLQEKHLSKQQTVLEIQEQLQETHELLEKTATEIQNLFDIVGVSEKEQFYTAYQQDQDAQLLIRQLKEVEAQLSLYSKEPLVKEWTIPELERQRSETTNRLHMIRQEVEVLVDEQVKVGHEISQMGASQTYSELQQLFEVRKAELEELTQQWVIRKAVRESIRQTMSEWKEHQLPAVLIQANNWFSRLTRNRYATLGLTVEGYFEAITAEGQSFMINELSQATKEQAYLSLRLALAYELLERAPFPIIMDDPFVHFDNERLSRMIDILTELQPSHQFLYFTCHQEMKSKWLSEPHTIEIGPKVKGEIH
ncbi:ATP-binding protein [Sporosarcina ureae]|uniref:ATP-binding protein n=1 Tax=Sporosarcina ureae TaxID=1571 RepID=UPI0028B087F5|nr:AAA family ATPase [Sporosarcina ureae]